jgi:hypothetical protein
MRSLCITLLRDYVAKRNFNAITFIVKVSFSGFCW